VIDVGDDGKIPSMLDGHIGGWHLYGSGGEESVILA
jgi:hypothetical protein